MVASDVDSTGSGSSGFHCLCLPLSAAMACRDRGGWSAARIEPYPSGQWTPPSAPPTPAVQNNQAKIPVTTKPVPPSPPPAVHDNQARIPVTEAEAVYVGVITMLELPPAQNPLVPQSIAAAPASPWMHAGVDAPPSLLPPESVLDVPLWLPAYNNYEHRIQCAGCGILSMTKLQQCKGCLYARRDGRMQDIHVPRYCSKGCQERHWHMHKSHCVSQRSAHVRRRIGSPTATEGPPPLVIPNEEEAAALAYGGGSSGSRQEES